MLLRYLKRLWIVAPFLPLETDSVSTTIVIETDYPNLNLLEVKHRVFEVFETCRISTDESFRLASSFHSLNRPWNKILRHWQSGSWRLLILRTNSKLSRYRLFLDLVISHWLNNFRATRLHRFNRDHNHFLPPDQQKTTTECTLYRLNRKRN